MKIKKLKINSFGKLENTEIEFSDNINIISGKNESGKSTLLKFIVSMFYGISKNKNGKTIPDFDKYKPWEKDEYSGKLTYTLDNIIPAVSSIHKSLLVPIYLEKWYE